MKNLYKHFYMRTYLHAYKLICVNMEMLKGNAKKCLRKC